MEIFSQRLNELIEQKQITKYRLAKDLGVNKQTIAFWLSGANEPKIGLLKEVAQYFGVSADYLLGLEDDFGVKADSEKTDIASFSEQEKQIIKKIRALPKACREMVLKMLDVSID